MIQDLLYYPDEVNVPEGIDIVLFRNRTDGYLYYKKSNGESIKLTDDGNGTIFNIPEPEVGQIFTLVIDTFYKIKFDTGLAIKFFQAPVKASENPFKKRQGNKIIYNSAPGSVGAQGAQGAAGATGAQGAAGAQGAQGAQGSAAAANGYTLTAFAQSTSPADATTYFIGWLYDRTFGTAGGVRRLYIPKTGSIKYVAVDFQQVAGSAETSTIYVRVNDTTDTVITAAVVNNATQTYFQNSALNIAVVQGDYIEIKWITPTWVTNPTSMSIGATIYIE